MCCGRRHSAFCPVVAASLYLPPLFRSALMAVSLTPAALERVQRFVQQT
ncbi:iron-sulfur cluster assembly accessory protein, partial [Xanthomonas perforans]